MRAQNERTVFREILAYSPLQLRDIFDVSDEGSFYRFIEKQNPSHYVTIDKTRKKSFWVPVNADFGFDRPAGSNNYDELIKVGKHLVHSFGLEISW